MLDGDTGQFRHRDLDPRHLLPAQIGAHNERDKGVLALDIAHDAPAVGLGHFDQFGDRVECAFEIAGLLGDGDDAIIGPVVSERCAKAVEDAPARRGQKPHVNAVLLSHDRVFVAVEDLQLVHAGGKGTA